MNIIQILPLPDEICHKILLYAFKSPHINLQEEIFKRALSIPIYQKLVVKGGIVKDGDGHVTELRVWDKYGNALLDADERMSIKFDIYVFHLLPNLTIVNLSGIHVTGNIAVLKSLPNLTKFNLQNANVFGNIQVLQGLPNLTEVNLSSTGVTGDIVVLQGLPNLTKFYLGGTGVFGNIQVLQGLPNLTSLWVTYTGAVGDKESFHNYRKFHGLKECYVYM